MKSKLALLFLAVLLVGSTAFARGGDVGTNLGFKYSPADFTATRTGSTSIELSSGLTNITGYTTAEFGSITVFSTNAAASVILPINNRFNYEQPTLEVRGANFKDNEWYVITIRENSQAVDQAGYTTLEVWPKATYTTAPTTLAFAKTSKSFVVTNYGSTAVAIVNIDGITREVDPAVDKEKEFPYQLSDINVYGKSVAVTLEIEVRE